MAGRMKRELMDALMSWGSEEEEGANDNEQSEDDETESEPERPGKRDADIVADSDSASDAAEDLDATSSDDEDEVDGDEEERPIKAKPERATSGHGRKKRAHKGMHGDGGIDFGDGGDDDDDDDDDEEDEEDEEDDDDDDTEDEENGENVDDMPVLRQVSSADFEQQARYEEEEEEIVVKEEQGLRSLFGDDDDDDDDEDEEDAEGNRTNQSSSVNAEAQDESVEEEDTTDSKHLSFTDELLSNGTGSVVDDTGDADDHEEGTVKATPLRIDPHERLDAKSLLSSIIANVSVRENKVLKRGDTLDGPPIEDPIAHIDEFKRKFRWPVRVINLPKNDFSQDPLEIYNDYELKLKKPAPSYQVLLSHQKARPNQRQQRTQSAFAKAPRPFVETAAAVAATVQQQQLSKKRKRSQNAAPTCEDVSAAALTTIARIGERFADRFLESLIRDNAKALQGNNDGYPQRSWIPLPVTRKPVATWRFVLENAMKNSAGGSGASGDSVCPPLRKETLQRIHDRLKTLNTLPWRNDDDELLDKVDHLVDASAAPAPAPAIDLRSESTNDGEIVML